MELIGLVFDKLIMLFAGIYISFLWPVSLRKKVEAGEAEESELIKFKWLRPLGLVLILLAIVLLIFKLK